MIWEFIKSVPTILSFLWQLKRAWDDFLNYKERREKLDQFSDALKEMRASGDSATIERLFRELSENTDKT